MFSSTVAVIHNFLGQSESQGQNVLGCFPVSSKFHVFKAQLEHTALQPANQQPGDCVTCSRAPAVEDGNRLERCINATPSVRLLFDICVVKPTF